MPQVHDGGAAPPPIVPINIVTPSPGGGGGGTTVEPGSGTVQQAVEEAAQTVKAVRTAPAIENLPSNAKPGAMYSFPSQPAVVYIYGFDNTWRALLLAEVS